MPLFDSFLRAWRQCSSDGKKPIFERLSQGYLKDTGLQFLELLLCAAAIYLVAKRVQWTSTLDVMLLFALTLLLLVIAADIIKRIFARDARDAQTNLYTQSARSRLLARELSRITSREGLSLCKSIRYVNGEARKRLDSICIESGHFADVTRSIGCAGIVAFVVGVAQQAVEQGVESVKPLLEAVGISMAFVAVIGYVSGRITRSIFAYIKGTSVRELTSFLNDLDFVSLWLEDGEGKSDLNPQ